MSIRAWHVSPANGLMTFWISPNPDVPGPQTWQVGIESCANLLYAPDIANSVTASVMRTSLKLLSDGTAAACVETNEGKVRTIAKGLEGCKQASWSKTFVPKPNWEYCDNPSTCWAEQSWSNDLGETTTLRLVLQFRGKNPASAALSAALGSDVMRAICWQESRWRQFQADGSPMRNSNPNGTTDWGCMQINQATKPQIWHWPSNVSGAQGIWAGKEGEARTHLNKHPPFTDDMLLKETLQRYNGGSYYRWNATNNRWDAAPPNGYVASVRQIMTQRPWPKRTQRVAKRQKPRPKATRTRSHKRAV